MGIEVAENASPVRDTVHAASGGELPSCVDKAHLVAVTDLQSSWHVLTEGFGVKGFWAKWHGRLKVRRRQWRSRTFQ